MSSSNKRWKLKNIFTSKTGCGCNPKETDIIEPEPKPKTSSSVLPGNEEPTEWNCSVGTVSQCPKIRNSLAIVKESNDPYEDFRQSMVQMIIEKEIYSRNDLQQLLHCFLQLNSPQHHDLIVRAFMEIWNGGGMEVEVEVEEEALCFAGNQQE